MIRMPLCFSFIVVFTDHAALVSECTSQRSDLRGKVASSSLRVKIALLFVNELFAKVR
jgi:hypothetical protein